MKKLLAFLLALLLAASLWACAAAIRRMLLTASS